VVWCDLGQALLVPADDAWTWLHRVLAATALAPPAAQRGPTRAGAR
jgi:hypothetical protein